MISFPSVNPGCTGGSVSSSDAVIVIVEPGEVTAVAPTQIKSPVPLCISKTATESPTCKGTASRLEDVIIIAIELKGLDPSHTGVKYWAFEDIPAKSNTVSKKLIKWNFFIIISFNKYTILFYSSLIQN